MPGWWMRLKTKPFWAAVTRCCANCGRGVVVGKRVGNYRFCSWTCVGNFGPPEFCQSCIDETDAISPGDFELTGGSGEDFVGGERVCPQCFSVVRAVWDKTFWIPMSHIPFDDYRVKYPFRTSEIFYARKLKIP